MDVLRLLSRSSGLKVGQDVSRQQQVQELFPSAGSAVAAAPESADDKTRTSKKRKREALRDDPADVAAANTTILTEVEIRQLQKQHKVKIIDLRARHDNTDDKTITTSVTSNRKARKEAARLYTQPLQSFKQLPTLGVHKTLVANIAEQAYMDPTEVQFATIPLLLQKDHAELDLLTVAPTGSGKTLAFLIPLIDKIAKAHQTDGKEARHVSAIILVPTKELVGQIVNEGRKLSLNTGVRITDMRKGMRLHEQFDAAGDSGNVDEKDEGERDDEVEEDGTDSDEDTAVRIKAETVVKADILVATPLSLLNSITSKTLSQPSSLPQIRSLILDEADVLLDPLFREQTLAIWSACSSPLLRTSLWSATIGSSIEELAIATINAHHQQNLPTSRSKSKSKSKSKPTPSLPPLVRTIVGLKDTSLPSITHKLIYASTEQGKLMGLRELIRPSPPNSSRQPQSKHKNSSSNPTATTTSNPSTTPDTTPLRPPFLIFTQTIPRAQSLHTELQYDIPPSAGGSSRIAVLHSNLTSTQRSDTMTRFRQGKIWILITTDLLSRGVDFRGVNGVVNYDIPTTPASYIHRAGRTGRAGRKGGVVATLYTRDDVKYLKFIANIISSSTSNPASTSTSTSTSSPTSTVPSSTPSPYDTNTTSHSPLSLPSNSDIPATPSSSLPAWLIPSLPHITRSTRTTLKQRGVDLRRAPKKSDTDQERRSKLKNRIGSTGGVQRKSEERRKSMVEGSKRRVRRELVASGGAKNGGGDGEFEGFAD